MDQETKNELQRRLQSLKAPKGISQTDWELKMIYLMYRDKESHKWPMKSEQFDCVAHIHDIVRAKIESKTICLGRIGQFGPGKTDTTIRPVYIIGRLALTGLFCQHGIRWLCPGYESKGLFGKGYVEVHREHVDSIMHLPLTK